MISAGSPANLRRKKSSVETPQRRTANCPTLPRITLTKEFPHHRTPEVAGGGDNFSL